MSAMLVNICMSPSKCYLQFMNNVSSKVLVIWHLPSSYLWHWFARHILKVKWSPQWTHFPRFFYVSIIPMVSFIMIQNLFKVQTYYIFLLFKFLCLLSSYPPLGNTLPSLSSLSEIIRSKRLRDLLWLKTELLDIWNCASLIFWRFLKPNGTLIYKMCKELPGPLI